MNKERPLRGTLRLIVISSGSVMSKHLRRELEYTNGIELLHFNREASIDAFVINGVGVATEERPIPRSQRRHVATSGLDDENFTVL